LVQHTQLSFPFQGIYDHANMKCLSPSVGQRGEGWHWPRTIPNS
jgi:hypothetical protein